MQQFGNKKNFKFSWAMRESTARACTNLEIS